MIEKPRKGSGIGSRSASETGRRVDGSIGLLKFPYYYGFDSIAIPSSKLSVVIENFVIEHFFLPTFHNYNTSYE